MLAEIARVEGFHFEETLTGFKWIGSRAETLSREEGYLSLFCYEEAIGFCCGDIVHDKDGTWHGIIVVSCLCLPCLFYLRTVPSIFLSFI
jgi:phosphomannomutase